MRNTICLDVIIWYINIVKYVDTYVNAHGRYVVLSPIEHFIRYNVCIIGVTVILFIVVIKYFA